MKRLLRLLRPAASPILAAAALALLASPPAHAEGTRTLHPASGDGSTGNRGVMDVSNTLNANVVRTRQFLYVYAEAGEVILLGSRNRSNSGDIFIYNPQSFGARGNETIPATADFSCSTQVGRGTIASRAEELAGPNSADLSQTVTGGFNPCWYVAPTSGIYGVRFTAANTGNTNDASIANPQVLNGERVAAWDVTVRSSTSSLADLNGRVFTYAWTVYLQANSRYLRNALYYVSSDGFRYKQTFRNLDPNRATFYANSQGFIDDGRPLYRDVRASSQAVSSGPSFSAGITAQAPQYPIFFSDVAADAPHAAEVNRVLTALAIPLAPAAPLLANPAFVGNLNGNQSTVSAGGVFTFDTQNTLTYEIVISFDGVNFDPAEVNNRVITGTALTGSHTVLWDGLNNNGVAFPAGDYEYRIYGRNGEIHFPMLDVEGNSWGGPTLEKLNGFQPADRFTVYYDDRGYRAANGTLIGALNGHLCGAGSPIAQPAPTHSLAGLDSNAGGPGSYYRRWNGSSDSNNDCNANANEFFATAKGLDLWALERSPEVVLPIEIVDPADGVDVGTQVSVTSTVLPGGTAYGSFVFTNAGDDPATGVTYGVTIGNPLDPSTCPASVNFTVLPPGVTATYNPAPLCTVTFGGAMPTTLNPGDSLGFNFNYVVAVGNPGPIPVSTTIAAGNENCTGTCAPNSAQAQTLVAQPIVTVGKSANPASGSAVDVGDTIAYTVSVAVANAPLTAVFSLDDTLGAGLTFGAVTSASPAFSCSGSLTCTLPAGTAVGTYSVTYTATVAATAVGSVGNTVVPSGGGGSTPPACQPTCATEHPVNTPSLAIAKSGPATAVVGVPYAYTLTVSNNGTADATANATVTDTVPAGLTIDAAGPGCTVAGQVVTCTVAAADLQVGESVVLTINVTPTSAAGASVSNLASVSGGGDPACIPVGDCDSPPVVTTLSAPDLDIAKTGPATAVVGVAFDYAFTVSNTGTADATADATVTDTVPAGLTINTAGPGCTVAGQVVTCNVAAADLQVGESVVLTINVTPTSAAGASVSNVASVTGGGDPACVVVGDCDSPPVVTTLSAPALDVAKSGPATAVIGVAFDYTLTVSNTGTADATADAVVTDTVPAGLTINSAGPGCVVAGQVVTCTVASSALTVGGSVVLTINVTPTLAAVPSVSNTASVTGGGDPGCVSAGDCESPPVVTTVAAPQVSVTKSANPADGTSVEPGDTVTYTLTVTVSDAATTDALVLTDTLDAQLENIQIVGNPGGFVPGGAGNTRTFTLPAGAAIGAHAVSYSADIAASATGTVGNNVLIDATDNGGDPDPTCSVCSTTHPLAPDVTLVKTLAAEGNTPADGIAAPGETLTYAITLTNTGGVDATGYAVTDVLDANVVFVGTDNGGVASAGSVAWTGLTVPASSSLVLTVTVTVADPLPQGVVRVVNLAHPIGGPLPVCPSAGCVETPVPQVPGLALAKDAVLDDANGNGVADADESIAYTLTATNTGNVALSDVVIDDPRLPLLTCAPTQPATLAIGASLVCTGSYTVTQADIDAGVAIDNTATATAPDPTDPDPVNPTLPPLEDEDSTSTPVATAAPGIELQKAITAGSPYANAGDAIAYQLTATNTGNVTLVDVVIADPMLGTLACTPAQPATLAPLDILVCTGSYTVAPADIDNGSVTNTATVTATPPGGGSVQDTDEAVANGPAAGPAIEVEKVRTDATAPVVAGTELGYSIVATNIGNVTLTDVTVGDTLIPALTCVPALPATLAAGASITCTGTYTATQADVDAGEVVNTATASGTPPGPVGTPPVTDSDEETTTIPSNPALEVTKTATLDDSNGNGVGDEGEVIDYAVSVRNTGNVTLTDLSVADSLDGAAPVVLTCTPTTLAPDATATCNAYSHTITLAEALAGNALENVATATAMDPNDTQVSDDDSASTPLGDVVADLAIVKTGPASGTVGENVTFTIVVTNLGPDTAVNTVLTDPTPAGLQFVSNAGDCSRAFPCDLGDLAVDETRTVQATFLIPEGYTGPSTILNIASVTSDSPDPTPGDTSSSASTVVGTGFTPPEPAVIPATRGQSLVFLALLMMLMASGALRRKW